MGGNISDFLQKLLDTSDWPPRWHCGKWTAFHGWLYIISDLLIWSAYFSIPLIIIRYISRRQDIRFIRLYFLFAAFILACGSTHLLDAVAFWQPAYRLNALVLLVTGLLSWATVFYLVKYLPVAFALKSAGELEREIEQRKKAERLSRESERQVQDLFDAAPDAVIVLNEEGHVVKWNPKAESLFGWSAMDAIDHPLSDLIIPQRYRGAHNLGLSPYLNTWQSAIPGKPLELQACTKEGKEMDVALSISPTVTNDRRLFVGFVRDITWQRKSQEEIKKLNADLERRVAERTRELYESQQLVSDYKFALDESAIVAITDQKGIITHVNDNFCKISKYSRGELLGQDHRIISSGYHPKTMIRDLWVTIAHGKIWRGELKNRAKDGTYYWVDTTIVPFLDESGKPYQYVAIRADVTHRKKVEEEFQKLNEELEDRVNLRTVQLEYARKEMEAFAYSVSHDLRAPLRGVLGFTSMLEEEYGSKLDGEGRRITAVIKNSTLKMGTLIDDLLAFSRAGKQELVMKTVDTAEMVREIIEELAPGSSDIHRIEWTVDPLPTAKGDLRMIRQVWVNLLSNAIKYSGRQEPARIEIGHFKQEGKIAFFVKDNGVGFDNKYKDKLFRVFQRLHKAEEFEGTGVGLALVEKIVSKHGGRVWAEGEPGNGARFCFSLPEGRYDGENSK